MNYKFFKKLFDLNLSIFLLIVLSPVFILVSIYIYFTIGPPIIFKDYRAGLNGQKFTLYKFRTMSLKKNFQYDIKDDRKRTLIKTLFLRKTRLDEIPQIFNIIKGDLSFVGPRPLLLEYNSLYSKKHKIRISILPGITGWSQVNLYKLNTWKEKFDYDTWYVKNRSFNLDIKIIYLTIILFFKLILNKKKNNKIFSEKYNGKN